MSRLSLAIAGALTLVLINCTKKGEPVKISDAKDDFEVQRLFTRDNCTVYRFYDNGYYRYFTNCSGSTMTTQSYQCGKMRCTRPEEISGGK